MKKKYNKGSWLEGFDAEHINAARCLLFCLGALTDLMDFGLIGGPISLSDKGLKQYNDLVDTGYEPTQEEIESTIGFLTSMSPEELSLAMNDGGLVN